MAEHDISTPEKQDEHTEKHGIAGTIGAFVAGHRAMSIGLIVGFAIIALVMYSKSRSASPSSTAGGQGTTGCQDTNGNPVSCSDPNAVNQAGNLAAAGYMPSGVAYGLDQITQQLNNLTTNLQNLLGGSSQSTGPSGTGGSNNPPGGLHGNPPVQGPVPQPALWQQLHLPGPIIPSGHLPTNFPSYSNLKPGTTYTYNGVKYTLTTSVKGEPGSGVLYGINPQGKTVVLYGPPSAYMPTNVGGTHDPIQSGIVSHNKLFHRGVGVPMPDSLVSTTGGAITGQRHF